MDPLIIERIMIMPDLPGEVFRNGLKVKARPNDKLVLCAIARCMKSDTDMRSGVKDQVTRGKPGEGKCQKRITGDYEFRKSAIKDFKKRYDELSKGASKGKLDIGPEKIELKETKPTIKNELVIAGSNEMRKLQIMGPQLQSETKKTNQLLSDIKTVLKDVESNQEDEKGNVPIVLDR